ncbi:MAG: hypothetical protein EA382_05245, partial [Spirochaetaceae bacterium]
MAPGSRMTGAQKFSISLLISVVVFSVLAVLVAVDRFRILETRFYVPRVEENVAARAALVADAIESFHRTNIARYREFTLDQAVTNSFRLNASAADLRERQVRLDAMKSEQASLDVVRIINLDGSELHYSSNPADFRQTATQRTYLRPDQVSERSTEPFPVESLAFFDALPDSALPSGASLPQPEVLIGYPTHQFVYRLPAVNANGVLQGAALFYVNLRDLRSTLIRRGLIGTGEELRLLESGGVVVNVRSALADTFSAAVVGAWPQIRQSPVRTSIVSDEADGRPSFAYEVFTVDSSFHGPYVYAEPAASLTMPVALQYTLVGAVFLTTFLLIFLFLNIRQDPVVVLSDRVKRFQINLLREFMERKDDLDFQRWKVELADRRDEVSKQIRRGIGHIRADKSQQVDALIDQSWDEIIDVLSHRAGDRPASSIDVDRIEEIIDQLSRRLSTASIAQIAPSAPRAEHPTPSAAVPTAPAMSGPVEVEEIDDDVDDIEELDDAELEDVDDADELEDADLEEVDDADELEVADDLGEAIEVVEFEDADGADELEDADLEEVDDADELEVADDLGEAIEVVELEDADGADELEDAGLDEVADAGELEDADDLGEAVEVAELEDADGAEELAGLEEDGASPVDDWTDDRLAEEVDDEVDEPDTEDSADGAVAPVTAAREVRLPTNVSIDALDELTELEWLAGGGDAQGEKLVRVDRIAAADDNTRQATDALDEAEELGELDEAEELGELDDAEELGELDEAEELSELTRPSTTFGAGFFSFGKGTVVRVPRALQQPDFTTNIDALEIADNGESADAIDGPGDAAAQTDSSPDSEREAQPSGTRSRGGLIRIDRDRSVETSHYEIATLSDL